MLRLDARVHLFAHPRVRDDLITCFRDVIGCGEPLAVPVPGLADPVIAFRFPDGGSLSIEFTPDALDTATHHLGAWLQITADRAALDRIRDAGYPVVRHPAHDFYFAAPGGQVFSIVEADAG